MSNAHNIGELNETDLHIALKNWFKKPGDLIEEKIDGYTIDIVRGNKLIEIQTRNLLALKKKINNLVDQYQIEIILPIIHKKMIIKMSSPDVIVSRRKSPKTGRVEDIFKELIYFTDYILHPNLILSVPLVDINEYWLNDGGGSWRRKGWSIDNKELVDVKEVYEFKTDSDYLELIPKSISTHFTNKDLSTSKNIPIRLTRKMTYCMRKMNLIEIVEKKGNAYVYKIS